MCKQMELMRVVVGGDNGQDKGREIGRGAPHLTICELIFTILEEMQPNMPLCECNRSQCPASP